MKFLLTNDDGIEAAGLAALHDAAQSLGECVVVAPAECFSGCSHRVTTDRPFRVRELAAQRYVVEATPADCVRVGLGQHPEFDWVLAGINHGGNLGADVHLSGTVAAVREGVLSGKPGIAVSQYHRKGIDPLDWPRASKWLTPVLAELLQRPWKPGTLWNINLPNLPEGSPAPEVVYCPVDPSPLPFEYELDGEMWKYAGNYHQRQFRAGTDIAVCFGGKISVSLVEVHSLLGD